MLLRSRKAKARPDPRPPRTRLGVDERRAQLLSLGTRIFSERPYDEISMDDLAREAGVSKGLVYHYFATKRDLYVAVLAQASAQLLEQTLPAKDLPPAEQVRVGLETYLDFVHQHGLAYVALICGGIGSDPEVAAILTRTRGTFLRRILDALPPDSVTPLLRTSLRGWIGFVEATAIEWLARRDVTRTELVTLLGTVLATCVQVADVGLAPPSAQGEARQS